MNLIIINNGLNQGSVLKWILLLMIILSFFKEDIIMIKQHTKIPGFIILNKIFGLKCLNIIFIILKIMPNLTLIL